MLALRVAIGPGVALLALLVVTSCIWVCLLVDGLKELLVAWIYWRLPLQVWVVRVVRHLTGGYGFGTTEDGSRDRCNIERGESVDDFNRKVQLHSFD